MNETLVVLNLCEKIVQIVIEKNDMTWIPENQMDNYLSVSGWGDNLIVPVAEAVYNVICKAESDFLEVKQEIEDMGKTDPKQFTHTALMAARIYFKSGYSHESFLCYCSIIGGVAMLFYKTGHIKILKYAAEVMGIVLNAHVLTGEFYQQGSFTGLGDFCSLFNKGIDLQKTREDAVVQSTEKLSLIDQGSS